ncbi:Sex comb on midleg-like protein 2, partial [Lemmus lemmus]
MTEVLLLGRRRPEENRAEGNAMGQTVNEESMDVKKDNQEKTTHSSTSSVQSNYFDWD